MTNPKPLPVASNWYEISHLGCGVSKILETHVAGWMRCNMWLVHGRTHDLLIDSGLGLRPLKGEIAQLRERPVSAICTHCHFDHIGCTHEFDVRLGHRIEADIFAHPDNDRTCATPWLGAELITALPCAGYEMKNYKVTPAPLTGHLDEGDVVDLGDRHFRVFHLPGHSPGSIALYEENTRMLFSGDVIFDGWMIDNAWHSNPDAYRESLGRLKELSVDIVHAGHEPSFSGEKLRELIDRFLAGDLHMPPVAQWLAEQSA
jgi:glyoxylase-like metal-dependent hydrolase (beta-lactamase superfamily II)